VSDPGYYIDSENNIKKCVEGCRHCQGENKNQCVELEAGYYFSDGDFHECPEGCAICNSNGECQECKIGL